MRPAPLCSFLLAVAWLAAWLVACGGARRDIIVVGSKNFPEQALLGEILAQQIEGRTHLHVERRFYLAGSFICQQAMLAGRIDTYVEYTGTALTAILHDPVDRDSKRCVRAGTDASTKRGSTSPCCLRSASTIHLRS